MVTLQQYNTPAWFWKLPATSTVWCILSNGVFDAITEIGFMQAQQCAIKVEIIDQSDLTKLRGVITGPPDTPFEGKTQSIDLA